MPRLDKVNRERVIGILDAGLSQGEVARCFDVDSTTLNRLVGRLRTTRSTDDRPTTGRPRVTSHVQDRYIRLRSLRNRFANAVTIAGDLPFRCRIVPEQFYVDSLPFVYVHGGLTGVLI